VSHNHTDLYNWSVFQTHTNTHTQRERERERERESERERDRERRRQRETERDRNSQNPVRRGSGTTELNRTFSKEEIQMAKKHINKCSPSVSIKKCKSKPQKDSTSTLLEYLSSKTPPTTDVGEDVGKKEPSYTAGGNVS
jgi:hypothetical protein